jgi:hypothetical protein
LRLILVTLTSDLINYLRAIFFWITYNVEAAAFLRLVGPLWAAWHCGNFIPIASENDLVNKDFFIQNNPKEKHL